jgi:TonB-linked SusC/RagA family outer membrane protein
MSKRFTHGTVVLAMLFLLPMASIAQKAITGHVLNKVDQTPVPGITVTVKGTHIGTSTAVDGGFVIKAKDGDILVVSGIGVVRTEQEVNGNELNIQVAADSKQLDQVVVTATGIKKEAKRLGYALQTIDASTLTTAREPDPLNSLKGQAAGLEININQEIGHPADIIMRGENSPGDRPLFVVDGVPISSDTYNLNADDIENFTVLKGPNAAALYGFQGKNGAVIITTKKGAKAKGKPVVTFNTSNQINKGFIALPKYQDLYGPGDNGKYAFGGGGSSASSYFGSGAIGVGVNDYDYDVWGPQFRGQALPQYDGAYNANVLYPTTFADGSTYKGHVAPTPWLARGKDNLKHFIQAGQLTANSISISSSTDKTDMRVSFGDTWQRGIVPNTQLNNLNGTLNLTQRFNEKFTVSTYLNYSRQSSPNVPDVSYGPNSIIYNIIIWGGADWSMKTMRNYWQPGRTGIEQQYEEYYRYNNPWFMSYEWLRGHYQNNEYGYVSANYKLNENIDFQFRPSFTTYDMFNSEKLPYSAGVYGRPLRQGDYRVDRRSQFDDNIDFQARYHRNEISGFLDVSAVGGVTDRNFKFNSNFESTNYLNAPGIYAFSNSQGNITGSSFSSSMLVLSAYYSVDLGYKSYVTANVTGRVDKSSSLPSNNDSYYYPSFNLATVVSEYVHLPQAISFLKFRASYAESKDGGTNPFFSADVSSTPAAGYGYYWLSPYNGPSYQFVKTYSLNPTYSSQSSARYTDQQVDPNIHTAERKATELGGTIRFLQNRIGLDVTHYRYWNELIAQQGTTNAAGYSSYLTNGNIYTNNGWEFVVDGKPIVNPHGWSWNVTANLFTFVKKWVSDANPTNWIYNGKRTDLVVDNGFIRTPSGQLVIDPSTGEYITYSQNGSPAQKVFGHSDPDFQWGLINTVSYKSFSLRFQFDGMVGGVMEDYVRVKTLQGGRHIEAATGAIGAARPSDEANVAAYTGPGVNLANGASPSTGITLDPLTGAITNMKDLTQTTNTSKSLVQPFVYQAASIGDLNYISKTYAKLREVTLTYRVPESVFGKRSIISNATVSLVGRNLLYFFPSRYKDLDVDQYSQGAYSVNTNGSFSSTPSNSSGLQTPTTRSYGLNVNFSF